MAEILLTNGESVEHESSNTLNPSELGTKEYWDSLYDRELSNYNEDVEDEGTIWFDESNAEEVVHRQLNKLKREELFQRYPKHRRSGNDSADEQHSPKPLRLLDLGTGNGHMLFSLLEEEDEGREDEAPTWLSAEMVGIDYSPISIELARQIANQKDLNTLRFEEWDILTSPTSPAPTWLQDGFDIVLDKGTFDAISLMPRDEGTVRDEGMLQDGEAERRRHPCEIYRSNVTPLIRPGGFLIVTSCNWTREELVRWLVKPDGNQESELAFYYEATYPTFVFGGQKGQSVVTVVCRKGGGGGDDSDVGP